MDEAVISMLRKIIKEELSSVISEVNDLKNEIKMLQTGYQKELPNMQEQLNMISLNNQNKDAKVDYSKREIPISINQSMKGMTENKTEMKTYEDLPDFPFWNMVLDKMEKTISKPSFETWFTGTNATQLGEDTIIVYSKNDFQASWLEQRYENQIISALKEVSDISYKIEFRS
jgi:hypothetical protein